MRGTATVIAAVAATVLIRWVIPRDAVDRVS